MHRTIRFIAFFVFVCRISESDSEALNFISEALYIPDLQVQTSAGILQGRKEVSKVKKSIHFTYEGIPYAEPPIGPLRFKAPKPAKKWSGVLDARATKSGCVEFIISRGIKNTATQGSEDCLYLNVYTPQSPKNVKKLLPVMVYIYGGAFFEGNANRSMYGPEHFLKETVLMVNFNYRVGVFGFFTTGDMYATGNYGLKDQNLVLKWIQKNIKNFGGDPNLVTIFGQSAGAASVHYHMISPMSKGLFHRAISQSGSVLCNWASQRNPLGVAYLTGIANGINAKSNKELVERLRKVNSEDLKLSQVGVLVTKFIRLLVDGLPFAPTIEPPHEGAFLTRSDLQLLEDGHFNKVPFMTGVTTSESLFFSFAVRMLEPIIFVFDVDPALITPPGLNIKDPNLATMVSQQIIKFYIKSGKLATENVESILKFLSDDQFLRPIRKTAVTMSKHVPVYFYLFSHEGTHDIEELLHPNLKGVGHTEELLYLFKIIRTSPKSKSDRKVEKRIVRLWANFAKYGNPTYQPDKLLDNIKWPKVDPSSRYRLNYVEIDDFLTVKKELQTREIEFWENLFRTYARPPLKCY